MQSGSQRLSANGRLLLAPPAFGSVTVGQTFAPTVSWGGSGTIIETTSLGNSYVVSSDGVITSWSFEAPSDVAPLKLKMLRSAGGSDFTTGFGARCSYVMRVT